jgi:hypothetical protein
MTRWGNITTQDDLNAWVENIHRAAIQGELRGRTTQN